jgi:hypothetical protein
VNLWLQDDGTVERVDTIGVALGTALPRYYIARGAKAADSLVWSDGRVRGQLGGATPPTTIEAVDQEAGAASYAFEALPLIVRAAPLAKGYKTKLTVHDPRFGTGPLELRVRREEELDGVGKMWEVETKYANIPQTFYVQQSTGRIALHELHLGKGVVLRSIATWALQ